MPSLTLDLETIPDPGMPPYTPRDGGDPFPPPPYWQIVCIGSLFADDAGRTVKIGFFAPEERAGLSGLIGFMSAKRPQLVTFNGRRFDMPVLTARCMRYGLAFPARFSNDVTHRYREEGHLDIADLIVDHGAGRHASLDAWAKLIGMPGKTDACGADVEAMVKEGRIADVQAYCMSDVVQTHALRLRFDLVRGRMDSVKYIYAMKSLIAAVDAHQSLNAFCSLMNLKRLLLEE